MRIFHRRLTPKREDFQSEAACVVLTDVLQVREEFVIQKSIEDIEALTMEDLQIREEFAKERQKTAVEDKI